MNFFLCHRIICFCSHLCLICIILFSIQMTCIHRCFQLNGWILDAFRSILNIYRIVIWRCNIIVTFLLPHTGKCCKNTSRKISFEKLKSALLYAVICFADADVYRYSPASLLWKTSMFTISHEREHLFSRSWISLLTYVSITSHVREKWNTCWTNTAMMLVNKGKDARITRKIYTINFIFMLQWPSFHCRKQTNKVKILI